MVMPLALPRQGRCRRRSEEGPRKESAHPRDLRRRGDAFRTRKTTPTRVRTRLLWMIRAAPAAMPAPSQWMEVWAKPGKQGGMLAEQIEWDEYWGEHTAAAGKPPVLDMNHEEAAKKDMRSTSWCLRVPKRRSVLGS